MGEWFWSLITGKEPVIVAGAAGGLVRWVRLKERFLDGCMSVGVGAICALYLSPIMDSVITGWIPSAALTEAQRIGFAGFVIGLLGVGSVGFILDSIRAATNRSKGG